MRFVTFLTPDHTRQHALHHRSHHHLHCGVRVGEPGSYKVVDLTAVFSDAARGDVASGAFHVAVARARTTGRIVSSDLSVLDIIDGWGVGGAELLSRLEDLLAIAPTDYLLPLENLKLCAPLPHPRSLRDGYAFRQHVETMRRNRGAEMIPEFDQFPVFYFGNHFSIYGPGELPVQRLQQERLDYELEGAVVVGKLGKNIPAARADSHIFGLTVMNDMSARALQTEEMKLSLGPAKGKDFATVLGPELVTLDELQQQTEPTAAGYRFNMAMTASVNRNRLSYGNLNQMTWTFAQIIERASLGVVLHPGEVIGSGTVGTGCLAELNSSKITDNLWLKVGDEVSLEIEGLGVLTNRIVAGTEDYTENDTEDDLVGIEQ